MHVVLSHGFSPFNSTVSLFGFSCLPLRGGEWGQEEGEGWFGGWKRKRNTDKQTGQHRVHRTCLINTDIYPAAVETLVEKFAVHFIVLDENGGNKWNRQSYKPSHLH